MLCVLKSLWIRLLTIHINYFEERAQAFFSVVNFTISFFFFLLTNICLLNSRLESEAGKKNFGKILIFNATCWKFKVSKVIGKVFVF